MINLALLVLRATTGSLLVGHGAQKLFGAFGGPGPEGTARTFESMGLKPGGLWARSASPPCAPGSMTCSPAAGRRPRAVRACR